MPYVEEVTGTENITNGNMPKPALVKAFIFNDWNDVYSTVQFLLRSSLGSVERMYGGMK